MLSPFVKTYDENQMGTIAKVHVTGFFFLYFPEDGLWYFMQIVSYGRRQFVWNDKTCFLEKKKQKKKKNKKNIFNL